MMSLQRLLLPAARIAGRPWGCPRKGMGGGAPTQLGRGCSPFLTLEGALPTADRVPFAARLPWLDNLRGGLVLLVVAYHIVYMFNSVGVLTNLAVPGVPEMDLFCYAVYPWFMSAFFCVSGISARLALQHVPARAFLRSRVRRLLLPSIAGTFLLGWVNGWVTSQYVDMFGTAALPGPVRYLIFCLSGTGPLWFCRQLFIATLLLLFLRRLDVRGTLDRAAEKLEKSPGPTLALLGLGYWGSAQMLNTPIVEVYRHGVYCYAVLLGYYIFARPRMLEWLARRRHWLLGLASGLGIAYIYEFWGQNYAATANLKGPLVNAFAWCTLLALLGWACAAANRETAFTRWIRPRGDSFYFLHYPLLCLTAHLLARFFAPPPWAYYPLLTLAACTLLPLFCAAVRCVPLLRLLLLGQ